MAKLTAKQKFSLRAAAQRLAKSAGHVWADLSREDRVSWRQKAANQITAADEQAAERAIVRRRAKRLET
jgi:hypothetical protein